MGRGTFYELSRGYEAVTEKFSPEMALKCQVAVNCSDRR